MRRHLKHIVKFKTEEGIVIQRMKKAVRKNGRPFQAKKNCAISFAATDRSVKLGR